MRELTKVFDVGNIAEILDEDELAQISERAFIGYDSDEDSRSEWKEKNNKGRELASQLVKKKTFPHENAANVMYPLISTASIQFASRAYPNLIPGWDIVKGKVVGKDNSGEKANKAKRVSTHMNYLLNEQMEEWEEDTDKLLTLLAVMGCEFKKTYYSTGDRRCKSVFCSAEDIVMHYKAKSMYSVPRITEKYQLYPNEIIERIRSGMFLEFDYGSAVETKDDQTIYSIQDEFKPHLCIEQHTWLDLDGDGYAEPYILNGHYDTRKIVRIVPRFSANSISYNTKKQIRKITPRHYYTKFSFIPSLDGSIYDMGFGQLLSPINHTVNTTINQLLDSGTLSNCQGGFLGKGASLGKGNSGGAIKLGLNEWRPVPVPGDDLRKNIFPLPKSEPSGVLFSLLGFMVNAGEKLSSVTELLLGEQSVQNEPATTSLARIEQGLKVFSAIHKRLHRAFSKEFKKIFILNSEYLDPEYYFRVLDNPELDQQIYQEDYDKESCDIIPTSSPEDVSNTQKMMKAQILMSLKGTGLNDGEITRRFLESMQITDHEELLKVQPPPPDPKMLELELKRDQLEFEMSKYADEQVKIRSEVIKNLAEAESKEQGPQLEQYKTDAQTLIKSMEIRNRNEADKRRVQGMVEQAGGGRSQEGVTE